MLVGRIGSVTEDAVGQLAMAEEEHRMSSTTMGEEGWTSELPFIMA